MTVSVDDGNINNESHNYLLGTQCELGIRLGAYTYLSHPALTAILEGS